MQKLSLDEVKIGMILARCVLKDGLNSAQKDLP